MTESETLASVYPAADSHQRRWFRHPAALAAGGFLAIRAVGLLVILWSPARGGRSLIDVLSSWDGGWYVRIAESGYADHLDLSAPQIDQITGSLAFFPVYPTLIRSVSRLTGLEAQTAGVVISVVAGAFAAAGIAVLASEWFGRRVGVLAALLWAAAPMGVVASMVYTEALFTALAVWTFLALRRHSWLLAGLLATVAGLTRPTGIALGAAVAAYAVWVWWAAARDPDESRVSRTPHEGQDSGTGALGAGGESLPATPSALPLVAAGLGLASTPAFWLWVGIRAGRWDAWFAVQDAFWGSRFDGGLSLWRLAGKLLAGQTPDGSVAMAMATLLCLLAAVALLILAIRARVWWPLLVYSAVSLTMVIGSAGYFSSKLRFLVPMFVLVLPLARWLAGRSRLMQVSAVIGAVILTTVSGAWLLLSWAYAI